MKKIFIAVFALSTLSISATAKQSRTRPAKNMENARGMHNGKGHEKLDELDLSDAQKTQIKATRASYKQQLDDLKNKNLSEADAKVQREVLRKQQQANIKAILTPAQQEKLKDQKDDLIQKGEGRKDDLQKMKADLNLSEVQGQQIKAINEKARLQMKAIKDNSSLSAEAKQAQLKSLRDQTQSQIKAVLTAEQIKKLNEQKKYGAKERGPRKFKK